jgi:serine-type D-Ala-D-Ala carboxypeptidase/endopeptidase (penicillin-binding protein 4)
MNRLRFAPFLLAIFAFWIDTAQAAPTPEGAIDVYRAALEARGFSMYHQGIIFETLDGKPLLTYNAECAFNPASVVKLATSAALVDRLGTDYRFPTAFFTNGTLDSATGVLTGNLVVVGSGDPAFVTENAFRVARELHSRGIVEVTGDLVVKGRFFMNYSASPVASGTALRTYLDEERWTKGVEAAYGRYRVQTNEVAPFDSVKIAGNVVATPDTSLAGLTPLFTHRSPHLIKVLKQLNNYSNNWMAHVLGASIGGTNAVEFTLGNSYGISPAEVRLQTTSGLGGNAMRPADITSLLRSLYPRLKKRGYGPADLMPVAGIDPGTLEDRFQESTSMGAIVAKTGTLRSVSALAGYMYTKRYGVVVFAIFDEWGSPVRYRGLQDLLVREMLEACGGAARIPYARPVGYSELSGALIERAPVSIPATPRVAVEAEN